MLSNDDLLSVQNNIYTLVDAEGYLVREDIEGERKRYPFEGGGGEYEAGSGIILSGNVFSIDQEVVATNSYVSGLIGNIDSILDNINGEVI